MNNNLENLEKKLNNLISKGYDFNSPQIIAVFKSISAEKAKMERNAHSNNFQNLNSKKLKELEDNYAKLLSQGFDHSSPKVLSVLRDISLEKTRLLNPQYRSTNTDTIKQTNSNKTKQAASRTQGKSQNITSKKPGCHFVIDALHGEYLLLNGDNKVVKRAETSPIANFFARSINRHKYKKTLKKDYKLYKNQCKKNHMKTNPSIKKSLRRIKFYLWLCPDADYTILNMLRLHIAKLNPSCKNYVYASESYLCELAHLNHGCTKNLPFDITLVCTDGKTSNNHKYISKCIPLKSNALNDYLANVQPKTKTKNNDYINSIRYTPNNKTYTNRAQQYYTSQAQKYAGVHFGAR